MIFPYLIHEDEDVTIYIIYMIKFRNMTKWWREEWSDLTATFSIHDFVKSTNMVEETIKRNLAMKKNKM